MLVSTMEVEAVPPPLIDGGPVGSTTDGARNVKRYKHLKRSFVEVATDSPAFEKEDPMQPESENWFEEDIAVDSDKEDDLNEREDGIPVVRFSKKVREDLGRWNSLMWDRDGSLLGANSNLIACMCLRTVLGNCLISLPIEYFREDAIKEILSKVGTPLKLDMTTAGVQRGKFARGAVEIDLMKPLVVVVMVDDLPRQVEFEGLHVICFACGEVGHRSATRSKNKKPTDSEVTQGSPQEHNMVENMHVEEPQPPPPIAKHGTWMIVNRKTKGFDKKPEKARDKSKGEATSNSVKPHKDLNVAQADNRSGGVSGVGRFPGRTVHPVHNVAKATSKEKQVDNVPVSNAFSYLQDLEGLPEAPVLLEEEMVTKVAPKAKNQRRNNKGKKTGYNCVRDVSDSCGPLVQGGCGTVPNQLFVFGNHSIATMNANSGNSATSSLDGATLPDKLGVDNHFVVDPLGFAGGLALFWRTSIFYFSVIRHTTQAIHGVVRGLDTTTTRVSFAYVRLNILAKEMFWSDCSNYAINNGGPWIMMGEFNDIIDDSEQWGSSAINMSRCAKFVDGFNDCGLLDMGTMGVRYSWFRQEGGRTVPRKKLDRVFWNLDAQALFPEAKAVIFPRTHSDHHHIMFIDLFVLKEPG
nr:uncharacterized protein LOC109154684 [Ipomoea trifida]